MTILVAPCFHWIGFHLVEELLNEGEEVVGMQKINTEKEENLALFLGRNSSFIHTDEIDNFEGVPFSSILTTDKYALTETLTTLEAKNYFYLTRGSETGSVKKDWTVINRPLLFGEWMDREEEGVYVEDTFISFHSNFFKENAVYIKDFVKAFIQLNSSAFHSPFMKMKAMNKPDKSKGSSNDVFVREGKPLKERFKMVEEHYQRFKELY